MITQQILKSILHYNQETGIFTWVKLRLNNKIKAGDVAGNLQPNGYICIRINGKDYRAHRLAWLYMHGEFPPDQINHVNHDKADNRIANLCCGSHRECHKNRGMQDNNKSGFTGVIWHKQTEKWMAYIKLNGKQKTLGYFDNLEEAILARQIANIEYGFHINHGRMVTGLN